MRVDRGEHNISRAIAARDCKDSQPGMTLGRPARGERAWQRRSEKWRAGSTTADNCGSDQLSKRGERAEQRRSMKVLVI